jgi:hypothetical protein
MAQPNGGGDGFGSPDVISAEADEHASSLNGFAGAGPEGPFVEHPELLVGAAFVGGLLLAGLVSRLGE